MQAGAKADRILVKERHGTMPAYPDQDILNACRTLFGFDSDVSREFLLTLKPHIVKTAFRKKAKETHPDLFTAHDPVVQKEQSEHFRVVNEAYEIMRKYCERRDRARVPAPRRAAASTPSFRVDETGWLYRGTVPQRRLEIGRFLYYRGNIPYYILIKALAWQMRQRPPVGTIAKQWGWLNDQHDPRRSCHTGASRTFSANGRCSSDFSPLTRRGSCSLTSARSRKSSAGILLSTDILCTTRWSVSPPSSAGTTHVIPSRQPSISKATAAVKSVVSDL